MRELLVKNTIDILNGFAFDSRLFNNQKIGLPIARIRDVTRGYSNTYYSGDYSNEYIINDGAILVGMDGEFNIAVWKGGKALLNQRVCKVIPKPKVVDETYIIYRLSVLLKEIEHNTPFVTVKHLSSEKLKIEKIILPPLPEQVRIADVLDKADRLRRLRHYSIVLGDNYLQSVFLEMFGDPVTNPLGWEMRKLGKHIKFITSGSRGWAQYYNPSGARFIRSLDVRMNYIDNSDAVFVTPPKSPETERTRVQVGDVLLTITGSRIGRVASVPIDIEEAYISQHVSLLRLDDELSPEYVTRFLSLPRGGQYQIAMNQYGQTKPGLNLSQIKDFIVPFPPKLLRIRYLEIVQRFEQLRSQQRETLRQSDHLFHSLMTQAFQGGS